MNSTLKRNLLKNLSAKRANGGFTLIELLVVVIIVGILAAVALPNLLGQIGKARETEGKNAVGSINRAAQAFHFEAQDFQPLADADPTAPTNALGVVVNSQYYNFSDAAVDGTAAIAIAAAEDTFSVAVNALDGVADGVRTYNGGVIFDADSAVYASAVCQSVAIDADATAMDALPTLAVGAGADVIGSVTCADDFTDLD